MPQAKTGSGSTASRTRPVGRMQNANLLPAPHIENNISAKGTVGALCQPPDERKGAGAMVTYSDLFTFVIMLCAVITLVINIRRKK